MLQWLRFDKWFLSHIQSKGPLKPDKDNLAVSDASDTEENDWQHVFVHQKCAVEFEIKAFCSENQDDKVDKLWDFLKSLPIMLDW